MRLNGQVLALEGLGIPAPRYLWSPAWIGLVFSYLVSFVVFHAAMTAGGVILFSLYHVPQAFRVVASDVLDFPPGRGVYLVRAAWLVIMYALAIASIVVAKGAEPKERGDDVTSAMTSSVMRATAFVVVMELASVIALFTWQGRS
jgi:ABC-type transporter Mla maintaining outer membrane lipid asymmetry permease subunit MlaE